MLGGTSGNDILVSSEGDDTVWGDAGNDRIEGGYGNDQLRGGAGDDIITDMGGDDNIQGGDGNDVIQGGNGVNLIIGGFGSDFIITGEDASEAIGGHGNDFILGSKANEQDMGNEGDDWIEKGTSDGAPGDNFDPLGNDPIIGNDVFIGDGENDKFNAEGGDDIMVGKTGFGDRYIGGSGFDWASFKGDPAGVHIDISDRFFDTPLAPGGTQPLARFDIVEGLSGSAMADVLKGDNEDAASLPNAGATGSVLTNIALIDGLGLLLDTAFGSHQTFYDGGNIILGGAGSDMIEGRGGDDIIDGDKWLNVRISVRTGIDPITGLPTGPELATFDTMTDTTLQTNMLNGTRNPGQLQIVREILTSATADYDTALFSGNIAEYEVSTVGVVTTVTHRLLDAAGDIIPGSIGVDGTDRLMNIERLMFADGSVLVGGSNAAPLGSPIIGGTPTEDQTLTVSMAGVTDANNSALGNSTGTIPAPVAYFWQSEVVPGSGVFADIVAFGAGEAERLHGPSLKLTDAEVGLVLRVRALYKDATGVLEEVYSAPTAAIANINDAPVIAGQIISDLTPTETETLTASPTILDGDGTTTSTLPTNGSKQCHRCGWRGGRLRRHRDRRHLHAR